MMGLKKFAAVMITGATLLSLTSCSKLEAVDKDTFISVVEEELGDEGDFEQQVVDLDGAETIAYGSMDDVQIYITEFESDKAAGNEGRSYIKSLKDSFDKHAFNGSHVSVTMGSYGYYVFSGKVTDTVDGEKTSIIVYGGVYYVDNYFYRITTENKDYKDIVNKIISELGFPKV